MPQRNWGSGSVRPRCGWPTGEPGAEVQVDFGRLGMLTDADDGRRRVVHGLIFTAVYSRHMFVWPTYRQTLGDVIAGFEAAWGFFGGYVGVDTAV